VSPSLNSLRPTSPANVGLGIAGAATGVQAHAPPGPRRGQASPFPSRPVEVAPAPLKRAVSSPQRSSVDSARDSLNGRPSIESASTESEASGGEEILNILSRFRERENLKPNARKLVLPVTREEEDDAPYGRASFWVDEDEGDDDVSRYSYADTTRMSTWSAVSGKPHAALDEQSSGEARERFLARVHGMIEKENGASPTPSRLGPGLGSASSPTLAAGRPGAGFTARKGTGMGAGERI
jgi:hypothetical protein